MKDDDTLERVVPVSRRNVLKAGAVTAAGVGLFAGTAAATNPKQINFCGCSQVCVEVTPSGGTYRVITAWKEDGEWMFNTPGDDQSRSYPGNPEDGGFCDDVEDDPGKKIIGVKAQGSDNYDIYCNPGRCAQDALSELFRRNSEFTCVNAGGGDEPDPVFDSGIDDPKGDTVDIYHGQCGKWGREPNPGPSPGGPNGPNND